LISGYVNKPEVASFIRKMLALVLVEKDKVDNQIPAALAKLADFGRNNAEHAAELLANAGLIHLYHLNDLGAAQNVLSQLETMGRNGDAAASEHAPVFGRLVDDYQRHRGADELERHFTALPETISPLTVVSLDQNYPNPFNPETLIRYQVSGENAQEVSLVIYYTLGQRVRTLVAGQKDRGSYSVQWDGRDNLGNDAASGMYFLRATLGAKTLTRKLMLLR
jgi:hypothetical protein